MCATALSDKKPNLLWSVLNNRCPRCRRGKLFTNPNPYDFRTSMRMPEHCPKCGQRFELQTGFYFGTGYVSYGLSILVLTIVFLSWAVSGGLSLQDNSIFWCLGVSIGILLILQSILQRLARSIWIAFFVRYDKNWQTSKGSSEILE